MKNYVYQTLEDFLDISTNYDVPTKVFELVDDVIKVEVNLRTFLISYEGVKTDKTVEKLREDGFKQVEIRETKPMITV